MNENMLVFLICSGIILYFFISMVCGVTGIVKYKPIKISDDFEIGYIKPVNTNSVNYSVTFDFDHKPVTTKTPKKLKHVSKKTKQNDNTTLLLKQIEDLQKQVDKLSAKQSKPPKSSKQKVEHTPLQQDCVDALVTLGYKPNVAKESAISFLSKNNIDSVEQFIVEYFKKG